MYTATIWHDKIPYSVHRWNNESESDKAYDFIQAPLDGNPIRYQGEIVYGIRVGRLPGEEDKQHRDNFIAVLGYLYQARDKNFNLLLRNFIRTLPRTISVILITSKGYRYRSSTTSTGIGATNSDGAMVSNNDVKTTCLLHLVDYLVKQEPDLPYEHNLRRALEMQVLGEFYYCDIPKWWSVPNDYWIASGLPLAEHSTYNDMH